MRLLLTSCGITNKSIENALLKLIGKPFSETKVAFIPTASNAEVGDKWWLIKDLVILRDLKLLEIDIVDFSAMPLEMAKERLKKADVLFFEGGNTFHLMYWINKLNLKPFFEELLETRVWVGASAGSMITGANIVDDEGKELAEKIGESVGAKGLGFVDFSLEPHYQVLAFGGWDESHAARVVEQFDEPIYLIDDNTAIVVDNGKIEVVSEGEWKKFNQAN